MKRSLLITGLCLLFITMLSQLAVANTNEAFMRIGRLWSVAEYDGAEGWTAQYAWPGGRIRFPDSDVKEMFGANVRKTGTLAGSKNWTGPNGELFAYWTSGMYRTYDYDYLPYWKDQQELTALYPVDQQLIQRWAQPNVVVNGVAVASDGGDDFTDLHTNTIVDPTLVTERAIRSVWRYSMGVEYDRMMYGYSTPGHEDYVLYDINFTNNGKIYGYPDAEDGGPTIWPYADWAWQLEGQKIEDFWWSMTMDPRPSNLGQNASFGSSDAVGEFIAPYADEGKERAFALFYDGDGEGGVVDWGDPGSTDEWVELLSPAFIIHGALYADESPKNKVNDWTQPKSTTIRHERDYDLGKTPKTMADQYNAMFVEGQHWPLNVSHREIASDIKIPSAYNCFGPYDFDYNESINITYVVAAGGINHDLCIEWGKKAKEADYTGPVMDELKQVFFTGRDSVLQTLDLANWNVNGDKGNHAKYDVPDAPRPPANFIVDTEGAAIRLTWTDESAQEADFDTGVNDFAGYRVYKAVGARDSTYRVIYDGKDLTCLDTEVSPGFQYFYYLVAYDDGTQNWENPGVSLESGKYYCWTGWAPEGAKPAVAPITQESKLEDIRVIPNPYSAAGMNFPGEEDKIRFAGLPGNCTIRIFTTNGDFVHEIIHDNGGGDEDWNLRTEDNQYVVSDVYIYTIESDLGDHVGKFIIIR